MGIDRVATFIRTKRTTDGKNRAGWLISRLVDVEGKNRAYPEAFVFMGDSHQPGSMTNLEREYHNIPTVAWIQVSVAEYNKILNNVYTTIIPE